MGSEPKINIGEWQKVTLSERVKKVIANYGRYAIPITTRQSRIIDLGFCLPDLFRRRDLNLLLYKHSDKYVIARSPEERFCDIPYQLVKRNFIPTPRKEDWVCEVELKDSSRLTVAVYVPRVLSILQDLFKKYKNLELNFTS